MKKKLKIIFLLLSCNSLPSNQREILKYTLNKEEMDLIQIFEIPEKKRSLFTLKLINKIFLKLLIIFEQFYLKIKKLNPKSYDLKINLEQIKINRLNPIRKKYSDYFKNSDLEKIRSLKPDLIFNFSDRLIKGEILNIPKFGILSFHLSDTDFQRNGLGGFYEIIEKQEYSSITVQKLNNLVDGGLIANRKYFKTLKFFTLNHNNLLNETPNTFKETIELLLSNKINFKKPQDYNKKLYKHPPSLISICKYFYFSYIK